MSIQLVGILNITPDSFSDGGEFIEPDVALARATLLFDDGASLVDVGGEATNPKAEPLSAAAEWGRLEPILQLLLPKYPGQISLDTRHPEIVERAVAISPDFIVNDVTTFINPAMIEVVARHGLRAIISHLPLEAGGDIQRAHREFQLTDPEQVRDELLAQKDKMVAAGIAAERITLDPGIGFGKSMQLNWKLLEFAKLVPGEAVMIGYSRKRFLTTDPQTGDIIESTDRYGVNINIAAAKIAITSGAAYLRVHDALIYRELLAGN